MNIRRIGASVLVLSCLLPAGAAAQSAAAGTIAGVVRDTTGAILPGVTVEASSPALIEKVRAVITDDQGNYKIVDLRPGTYTVTFRLPGFSTFRREGLELTTGFTAAANAEMKVGALEETVTVTGASPVVDVQNVRTQTVLSRQMLDTLPTGKTMQGFAALTLGVMTSSQDVGGNKAEAATQLTFHGARGDDLKRKQDGMSFNSLHGPGGGQNTTYRVNQVGIQETVLEAGSNAESETGGLQVNNVPKDGGNTFRLYLAGSYSDDNLQGLNLSDSLRSRGLTTVSSVRKIWDHGVGLGGPIRKDRLWFYSANRWWGAHEYQPDTYYNAVPATLFYTADRSRPAFTDSHVKDFGGRLTWQATQKQKVTIAENAQRSCNCFLGLNSTSAPEATPNAEHGWNHLVQSTWSYPVRSRLLLQAGVTLGYNELNSSFVDGVTADSIGVTELSTGLRYGAQVGLSSISYGNGNLSSSVSEHVTVSYVTGSHAFKVGAGSLQGWHNQNRYVNQSLDYTFRLGVPTSLRQWVSPTAWRLRAGGLGLYAQDQWTVRRLTLNYGLRFDSFRGRTVDDQLPPARFAPARNFAAVENVPNWKDVSPRLGMAYDLWGNGSTAIKGALGRYVTSMGIGIAEANHPAMTLVTNATRTWNDANGNYVPDCDLQSRVANGECGALGNNAFGTNVVNTRYSGDVLNGFGAREYNWQASATVQHELRPGLALNGGYFRTWYSNFTVTDNLSVTPSDFDPYCITAPADQRLPGGGGSRLCGLYNVQPARFGQVNNLVSQMSNFGERTEVYNGVDIGLSGRFGSGGLFSGGVSLGRTATSNCAVVDSPQDARAGFCDVMPPWSAGTQAKFNGMYPLPADFQVSAVLQNLPGIPVSANYVATNAEIAPSLGRSLAGCPAAGTCTSTATVPVVPPGTMFEDRLTQVDIRLTKIVRAGRARVQGSFDVYNLFNASTILGVNGTYGPAWLRPTSVLGARVFKFGAQVDF